jgi:hypothetical protein
VKSITEDRNLKLPERMPFLNITPHLKAIVRKSEI